MIWLVFLKIFRDPSETSEVARHTRFNRVFLLNKGVVHLLLPAANILSWSKLRSQRSEPGQNREVKQACERNQAIDDSNGPETDRGLISASRSSTKLQRPRILPGLRRSQLIAIVPWRWTGKID